MECIATSYAPLILEPDSTSDWTKQHVLSEQLRQAEHKQPTTTTTTTSTSTTSTTASKRLSTHPHSASKRPRHHHHNQLHIPNPTTSRLHQPILITPTNPLPPPPPKSPQHWADLLASATTTLHSLYAHLPPPPPAPKARRSAPPLPEFAAGLDRVQLASRAMQMAAGFAAHDEDDESSGSESEVEAPPTPVGVAEGVMMEIDPRLFA